MTKIMHMTETKKLHPKIIQYINGISFPSDFNIIFFYSRPYHCSRGCKSYQPRTYNINHNIGYNIANPIFDFLFPPHA